MPPRPSVASKASRPLSAIFIGNQSNGTNSTNNNGHASSASISSTPLPDLPEPPSPVSSVGSGLPSPPATNSTGSGSTGDPGSVAARRPPASMASDSSRLSDDPDIDEDHTMRLKIGTNESVLQRARSLAQRNKLQLDKIASSRLGRASPAASHRHSMPDPSQVLSGSETERENDSAVFNSTSTSSSSKSNRVRLSSAPSSPHRARTTHSGTSSPTRRRKRVSLAFDDSGDDENYERRQDPQRAPTVSLNSAKKTSLGSTRRRSALPREFREGSSDDPITEPQTPYRPPSSTGPTPSTSTMSNNTLSRRSTLRTARGLSDDYRPSPASSTRDLPTSPLSASTTPTTPASTTSSTKTNESYDNSPTILARSNTLGRAAARERRQTLRGGSAESALGSPGGRSLVGEGLRAAGLSRRVGVGTSVRGERTISAGVAEIREMDRASTISGRSSRASSRRTEESPTTAAPPTTSSPDVFKDGRRVDWSPESSDALARPRREFSRTLPPRASTSMADYSYTSRTRQRHTHTQHSDSEDDHDHDIDEEHEKEREGRRDLRTYKSSTHSYNMINSREASLTRREQSLLERERELGRKERELERDRERAASALGRHTPTPYASSTSTIRERFGSIRRTPGGSTTSSSSSHTHSQSQSQSQSHHSQPSQTQTEHAKLMVDSLTMFESQLHKLSRVLHGNNSTNSTSNSPSNRDNLNKSGGPGATSSPSPSPAPGTNHIDMLTRTAQTLVISAERLNTMLKAGNARALDAQIEAEVEGDDLPPPSSASTSGNRGGGGGGSSLADVWRRIGGEYREGVRVSDELVRAVTGLLLGVGRIVKEYGSSQVGGYAGSEVGGGYSGGTPRGSPVVHWRSVSLGEDEVRVRAGEEFGRESRRSWEPSLSNGSGGGGGGGMSSAASTSTAGPSTGSREEALRRLAGIRSDSPLARASPAFQAVRELDRLETIASPGMGTGLGLPKVNIPAARRLFAPSQQREMALVAGGGSGGGGGGGGGSGYDYENDPSPTPLSRTLRVYDRGGGGEALSPSQQVQQLYQTQSPSVVPQHLDGAGTGTLERSRTITLPSVGQGQGHHGHVFETPLRRNVTISVPSGGGGGRAEGGDGTLSSRDRHERRKISVASIATIRAATSNTTNPTTATTTTTSSATSSSNASSALHHQPPGFSALTTPSGATTAVTLGGGGIAVGMARTESGTTTATSSSSAVTSGSSSLYSTATRPTFSRPEGILGLQQQLEGYRKRAENEHVGVDGNALDSSGSGGEGGGGKRRYGNSISLMTPESERETRRKTYGVGSRVGARVSLDSPTGGNGGGGGDGGGSGRPVVVDLTVNAADRSAAATISGSAAGPGRKERRRTVTDIWPRS